MDAPGKSFLDQDLVADTTAPGNRREDQMMEGYWWTMVTKVQGTDIATLKPGGWLRGVDMAQKQA
eukprot:7716872-Ditylum_brightwellii.AAC.1